MMTEVQQSRPAYYPWCELHKAPPSTLYVVYEIQAPQTPLLATYDSKEAVDMMVAQSHLPPEAGTYKVAVYHLVKP